MRSRVIWAMFFAVEMSWPADPLKKSHPSPAPWKTKKLDLPPPPCSSPCRDQRRWSGAERRSALRRRSEVWLVDFGMAGKTRPALVVSRAFGDQDRALITVILHTTSLRDLA